MLRKLFLILILSAISLSLYPQQRQKDTALLKIHSPTKATIYSALLPGLGQAYNKKYWKIPIIYAGAGTLVYFINFNSKYYNDFRESYKNRINNLPDKHPQYNETDLISLRDYYRRNLELTYIISGAVYILNILDAAVDANLYNYNISDNISLYAAPSYDKNFTFALNIKLKF